MRLAWFRATTPDSGDLLDRTASLIDTLRHHHVIDVVTAAGAHDFVWKHGRQAYDLCVYEVGRSRAHRFIEPYLLHYPGVVYVAGATMNDSRMWSRSRMVVVSDAAAANALSSEWPTARIRQVPLGVREFQGPGPAFLVHELGVAAIDASCQMVVERAVARARNLGAAVHLRDSPEDADVIVALEWPPTSGPPLAALHAMASGRVAIVLEVEVTAEWPALDPHSWVPRGFSAERPIVISLDPRDEEHSLMLALVRLAGDASVGRALAAAAGTWWQAHARIDLASAGWEAVLHEALTFGPASPQHVADGSERARDVLAEMGVEVDFLNREL